MARSNGKSRARVNSTVGDTSATAPARIMAIEIAAGHLFGSMALLADGWHMGTHAAEYRERIRIHEELVHFNLEVAHCDRRYSRYAHPCR